MATTRSSGPVEQLPSRKRRLQSRERKALRAKNKAEEEAAREKADENEKSHENTDEQQWYIANNIATTEPAVERAWKIVSAPSKTTPVKNPPTDTSKPKKKATKKNPRKAKVPVSHFLSKRSSPDIIANHRPRTASTTVAPAASTADSSPLASVLANVSTKL